MKFFIYSTLLFSGIIQNIYTMEQEQQSSPPRLYPPCNLHIKSDNSLIINDQHYPDITEFIQTDPELAPKFVTYLAAKTRKLNHKVQQQDEKIKKLEEHYKKIKRKIY